MFALRFNRHNFHHAEVSRKIITNATRHQISAAALAMTPNILIAKIDSALRRIETDDYGYCDVTGDPISLKRLIARPTATMSLEAQEKHERRERVYRDD